ncbi:hypothetical protein [Streptomyces sp. NPDC002845]
MKADDRTNPDAVAVPEHLARDLDRDELSRLVREVNDTGVSYAAMEKRARKAGYQLSRSQFNKMAARTVTNPPGEKYLLALAAGLQKPYRIVARAAARQYMNFDSTELSGYGDDVRVIVAHLAGMETDDQRRWRAMIEADERAKAQGEDDSDA